MRYAEIVKSIFPAFGNNATPQTVPLPGQVLNDAGGYVYAVDDWMQLDRFLILGSDSGTYYVSPVALTVKNAGAVARLLANDGVKVVARILDISQSGRAPKNDAALFALAMAAACDDLPTRQAALAALPKVARTGTHLLQFAGNVNQMRGWGRALRRAVGAWFTDMPLEQLSLQAVKYAQREGWALRDLLRLSHPVCGDDVGRRALLNWIVRPDDAEAIAAARQLRLIEGRYQAKAAPDAAATAAIIRQYSLPREAVPGEMLNYAEVWDALLVDMPMTAMIRNLGKMSQIGLLAPLSAASGYVAERLVDVEQLAKARISPFQLLLALRTYAQGHGHLGSLTWTPADNVVAALDAAFDLSFKAVVPTGKRILVGVDVSGSMQGCTCTGSPVLKAAEAAAAVASFLVRTEKNVHVMSFDTAARPFPITPRQRLDDILASVKQWGGGTDLSLPVTYALERKLNVDAIVILTDNETWAGKQHAVQALADYRARINPAVKLMVMATSANHGQVCDPADALSLGVAGFDAAGPQVAMDFIKGAA